MPREQTYIMIKPDGVQRGLIGEITRRFEAKGFKMVAMKMTSPSKAHLEKRTFSSKISLFSRVTLQIIHLLHNIIEIQKSKSHTHTHVTV